MADTNLQAQDKAKPAGDTSATQLVHRLNNPLSSVMANVAFAVENLEALRGSFAIGTGALRPAERARALGVIDEVCAVLDDAYRSSAQVQQIIRDMGGFDVKSGEEGHPVTGPGDEEKLATSQRRGAVLVIDDEPAVARSIERILRGQHDVSVETNPRAALALLLGGASFDVVFCDLMMPDLTGMALYDALVSARPEVAQLMVFLTGGATTWQAEAFVNSTERPVMHKPFTIHALRAKAAEYVK